MGKRHFKNEFQCRFFTASQSTAPLTLGVLKKLAGLQQGQGPLAAGAAPTESRSRGGEPGTQHSAEDPELNPSVAMLPL